MTYLQQARHDALAGLDGNYIAMTSCIFCPLAIDRVCMAYQQELDDLSKKPPYCRYLGFVTGGDNSERED